MPEQRIIGSSSKIGGQRSSSTHTEPEPTPAPKKRGRRGLVVVAALVVAAGAGWFLLRPGAASETEPTEVELGTVQAVEPISINLAGGRYLRLGLGLQLTAEVPEDVDTVKALDLAIALFSQRPVEEIRTAEGRDALKRELAAQLTEVYEGEVVDVYFSNFVYQ
ncbi:flagellar basal body-associated FliL family protein [Cellulomonas sp. ES6]|uniref:flagellar basal body-associated FliL family protein n=1 Tax=Cellulomonas sp. ES6 TaxID=3039384 RepID=UPI0024B66474|nr:flagellar basal body-associated FliL family protein [Cellulomonas sp. ES6]WHP16575.1 flagellar basal body-associated FliL family protein [Cellulomonas sp. ES6]